MSCEHGEHDGPDAPEGKRFCSDACCRCEHESTDENTGCDGICFATPGVAPKLTDQQRILLEIVVEGRIVRGFQKPVALRLAALGLADVAPTPDARGLVVVINMAGRAWLALHGVT